jgi:hypothetical protein
MSDDFCPFCAQQNDEQVLVCRACHRDIAIPPSLKAEHLELSLKCEVLRTELDDVKTRLGASRRWFGLQPPGSKL